MGRRVGKLPELYQEGSYKKTKSGKIINLGKPIRTPTSNAWAASRSTGKQSHPPSVPLRHFEEENDMDTGLDYFDLDSQLPSQEEVCPSYGKVASQILFMNKWAQQFYRLKMSTWTSGYQSVWPICRGLLLQKVLIPTPVFAARRLLVGYAIAA